jgi:hypothetical protein
MLSLNGAIPDSSVVDCPISDFRAPLHQALVSHDCRPSLVLWRMKSDLMLYTGSVLQQSVFLENALKHFNA